MSLLLLSLLGCPEPPAGNTDAPPPAQPDAPAPPAAPEPVVAPAPSRPPRPIAMAEAVDEATPLAPESAAIAPAQEPVAVAPAPVAVAGIPAAAPAPGPDAPDFARVFGEAEVDRAALLGLQQRGIIQRYESWPGRAVLFLWPRQEPIRFELPWRPRLAVHGRAQPSRLWDYYDPERKVALVDGRRSILVGARMNDEVRVDRWAADVNALLAHFEAERGPGLRIDRVFEQEQYTVNKLTTLLENLMAGVAVIIAVVVIAVTIVPTARKHLPQPLPERVEGHAEWLHDRMEEAERVLLLLVFAE